MYHEMTIRDFRGGLNTQDLPVSMDGADGRMMFPGMYNLLPTHQGRLTVRGGQSKFGASLGGDPRGFTRFFSTTNERYLVAVSASVIAFDTSGATVGTVFTDLDGTYTVDFEAMYGRCFLTDGVTAPRKYNGVTGYVMGIAAPVAACVASDSGVAGNLTSSTVGLSPYVYYYTFINADGTESNPSPASAGLTITAHKATITGIAVSADPQVTKRRLYRVGGSSIDYRFVTEIADNTTTVYTDNIGDGNLSLTLLNFGHDQPPVGVRFFTAHKNRLWAAGDTAHPYRIYFSSYQFPEYWPQVVSDELIDGGFFDIDANYGDGLEGNEVIGFGTTGSTLLVFTPTAIYAVLGDSFQDFVIRKIHPVGCMARLSIVNCKGTVIYMGTDGMVYGVSDTEPLPMALPIENLLRSVSVTDQMTANACYLDQRYVLFIPKVQSGLETPIPLNLCYDFRTQSWSDYSDPALRGTNIVATTGLNLGGSVYFTTVSNYLDTSDLPFHGVIQALSQKQGSSLMPFSLTSPEFELGAPSNTKRAKHLRLEGSVMTDGTPTKLRILAKTPGMADLFFDVVIQDSDTQTTLIDQALPPWLYGTKFQFVYSGSCTKLEINTLNFWYQVIRTFK